MGKAIFLLSSQEAAAREALCSRIPDEVLPLSSSVINEKHEGTEIPRERGETGKQRKRKAQGQKYGQREKTKVRVSHGHSLRLLDYVTGNRKRMSQGSMIEGRERFCFLCAMQCPTHEAIWRERRRKIGCGGGTRGRGKGERRREARKGERRDEERGERERGPDEGDTERRTKTR
ncbi:unnamed protein product [Arctogadus glacialis]